MSGQLFKTVCQLGLLSALLYGFSTTGWANQPLQTLQIANKQIKVEIADSESNRRTGLMHRTSLDEDSGMLFVFPDSDIHCFWMKNTLLPLSIAFINEENTITDIKDMQPQSLDGHCPSEKINRALEMNQGWFENNNIQVGDRLKTE